MASPNMLRPKEIINKALKLKPAERFIVIEALTKSPDNPDPEIEKA